MHKRKKS